MKKILLTLTLTFSTFNAQAYGTFNDAKITQIRVDHNGRAMIFFDKDKTNTNTPATCVHSSYQRALGVDATTDGGKAVLSIALAAKATNSLVKVNGSGSCGVYGGTIVETWDHGFIK